VYQDEGLGKCPLCGKGVICEGKKTFFCSRYKAEPPCAFVIWKETAGASVTEADVKLLLSGKHTKPKKCRSKAGKEFRAAFYLDKEKKVAFAFEERKEAKK